jgi:Spy/CpxP family protein refolding chaperone
MKTRKILALTALTSALTFGTLYAQPTNESEPTKSERCQGKGGFYGKHHRGGHHFKKIMKELDLTSEQKSALKALKKQKRETMKANRDAMKAERKAVLANAVTANGFDKNAFIEGARAKFEKKIAMKAEHMEAMMNILTPEQRTKFVELLNEK